MTSTYVFDNAWELERERLRGIELRLDPGTTRHFDEIGVREGWTCLEIGGGGGSVAQWLAHRVGSSGRVLATDLDTRFLDALDESNLEVLRHDITCDELPEDAFDLIHARLVLEHLVDRDVVLKKLVSALKPGGWIVLEDADFRAMLVDPPVVAIYPPADVERSVRVWRGAIAVMQSAGWDASYAARIPDVFAAAGLQDIGAESLGAMWRGGTPAGATPRWTLERLRPGIVALNTCSEEDLDWEIARFDEPDRSGIVVHIVSAWGRRPESAEARAAGRLPTRSGALVDRLVETALFETCTIDDIARIAALAREVEVDRGAVLTREGEAGDLFYVILQGTATVTRASTRLATIGPGSFFGETALLTGGPRTATVTADTRLLLAVLDKSRFDQVLAEVPIVARRILQGVAERSTPMTFFL